MAHAHSRGPLEILSWWLDGGRPDGPRSAFQISAAAARAQREWLEFTVNRRPGWMVRSPVGLLFVGIGTPAVLDLEGRCSVHRGDGRSDCWHRQLADEARELGWDAQAPGDWRLLRPGPDTMRFLSHQSDLEVVLRVSGRRWRWLPDFRPDSGLRLDVRRTSAGTTIWSCALGRNAVLPVQDAVFDRSRGLIAAWLNFALDCGLRLPHAATAPGRLQQAAWGISGLTLPLFAVAGQAPEAVAIWLFAGLLTLNRTSGNSRYGEQVTTLAGGLSRTSALPQLSLAEFSDPRLRGTVERLLSFQRAFHRLAASGAKRNPKDLDQLDRIVTNALSLAYRLDQLRSNVILKRERLRLDGTDEPQPVQREHRQAFERLDRVAGQVERSLETAADQLALSYTRLQGINLVEDLALDFNVSLKTLEDQAEFLRALEAANEELYAVLREDVSLLEGDALVAAEEAPDQQARANGAGG